MRRTTFRILAGLLGVLFLACLFLAPPAGIFETITTALLGCAFTLYSMLGEHPLVYRLLHHGRKETTVREHEIDDVNSDGGEYEEAPQIRGEVKDSPEG